MKYEWDDAKKLSNFEKHGVDFCDAVYFNWQHALIIEDARNDYAEDRFNAFAPINNRLYVMTYTLRDDVIRVISLRKANKREVNYYVSNFQNLNAD
ncbi:MAG: BrnT family toxin [Methylococcaceae bacterium]|jgi:uncharacterized DUF497 family protein